MIAVTNLNLLAASPTLICVQGYQLGLDFPVNFGESSTSIRGRKTEYYLPTSNRAGVAIIVNCRLIVSLV